MKTLFALGSVGGEEDSPGTRRSSEMDAEIGEGDSCLVYDRESEGEDYLVLY